MLLFLRIIVLQFVLKPIAWTVAWMGTRRVWQARWELWKLEDRVYWPKRKWR